MLVKLQQTLKVDPPEDEDFIGEWIEEIVTSKAETELLDMTFFAEYNQQTGFKIAVDGLHNTPNGIPYGALFSLQPSSDGEMSNVNIASTIDWQSPNRSLKFLDGFYHFRDIPGQTNLSVVFDVRAIEFAGGKIGLREAGWTIVPIFKK